MKAQLLKPMLILIAFGGPAAFAQDSARIAQQTFANHNQQTSQRFPGMSADQHQRIIQAASSTLVAQSSENQHHPVTSGEHRNLSIPKPLQVEHEELHSDLAQLTKAGGRTGQAAQKLAEALDPPFPKGERVCAASNRPPGPSITG